MLQNSMVNMIMRTLYLQKLNMVLKETKVLKPVNSVRVCARTRKRTHSQLHVTCMQTRAS